MFKHLREPVNGLSHLFAALAALIGSLILLGLSWGDWAKQISLGVYGASLVALLSASAAYHLAQTTPEKILILRKLDHAAIYALIAGTYTPICFNVLTGFWQWGMLTLIWALAIIGVGFKMFFIHLPRWFTAAVYMAMSWLGVAGIGELARALPVGAIYWLAAGGLFFTVGAVVYITKIFDFKPGIFGFHEVWHMFVIAGCACHFVVMLWYIAPHPAGS